MPTTLQDIADHLHLSKSLVKGVLANRQGIWASSENRRRILEAASAMGYRPNLTARSLATGRTQMIGLWINNLDDPHYAHILRCLQEKLAADKFHLVISETVDAGESADGMWEWPSDGIIAVDCVARVEAYTQAAGGDTLPFVSLGVRHPLDVDSVHFDLLSGARQAIGHLISTGRKSIVFLSNTGASDDREPRLIAYHEAMDAAGLPHRIVASNGRYPIDGRRAIEYLLDNEPLPDAVFAEDDLLALGVYKAILDRGLRIPQDVALMGCDDTFGMDCLHPAVSSIQMPAESGSAEAWRILKRRIADRDAEIEHVTIPTQLVLRASSEATH